MTSSLQAPFFVDGEALDAREAHQRVRPHQLLLDEQDERRAPRQDAGAVVFGEPGVDLVERRRT